MAKENLMKDIHEKSAYADLTPGGDIYGSGNSHFFNTGEWRTATPCSFLKTANSASCAYRSAPTALSRW